MSDYISRADAIRVAKEECEMGTFYDIPSKLEALPSADAVSRDVHVGIVNELVKRIEELKADSVKVVRCKDCRHAYFKDFDKYCPYMVGWLKPNQFCSHGELAEQTKAKEITDKDEEQRLAQHTQENVGLVLTDQAARCHLTGTVTGDGHRQVYIT